MRELFRLGATAIIWIALTIILTSSNAAVSGGSTVLLIVAGMFSTIAIWATNNGSSRSRDDNYDAVKAKRGSRDRLTRAIQHMDDDEIAQLSDLLSQNDDSARYNERLSR